MRKLCALMWLAMIVGGMSVVPLSLNAQEEPGKEGYKVVIECEGGKPLVNGSGEKECNYKDFLNQIQHIITLLLYIAVVLAVISFVYAGFKLLFSGGNEEALKSAKHIFVNVLIGLILTYGAWLIVRFVVVSLGVKEKANYTLIDGVE